MWQIMRERVMQTGLKSKGMFRRLPKACLEMGPCACLHFTGNSCKLQHFEAIISIDFQVFSINSDIQQIFENTKLIPSTDGRYPEKRFVSLLRISPDV